MGVMEGLGQQSTDNRRLRAAGLVLRLKTSLRVAWKYEQNAAAAVRSDSPATAERSRESAARSYAAANDAEKQLMALFEEEAG